LAHQNEKGIITDALNLLILLNGVEGDRTPDLMNAIHALSQLSYDPNLSIPDSKFQIPEQQI
jgi:hypothetical protein